MRVLIPREVSNRKYISFSHAAPYIGFQSQKEREALINRDFYPKITNYEANSRSCSWALAVVLHCGFPTSGMLLTTYHLLFGYLLKRPQIPLFRLTPQLALSTFISIIRFTDSGGLLTTNPASSSSPLVSSPIGHGSTTSKLHACTFLNGANRTRSGTLTPKSIISTTREWTRRRVKAWCEFGRFVILA